MKKEDIQDAHLVNCNRSSLREKPAKPEHGCLKPARTIPENLDLGESFAKKILTLRQPVTDLDRCNACEPWRTGVHGQAKAAQLYRTSRPLSCHFQ
ncbi:hypothetical protein ACVW0Y_003752 [Pseudomonas sp. TE3786]